jgi:hypothetical protein
MPGAPSRFKAGPCGLAGSLTTLTDFEINVDVLRGGLFASLERRRSGFSLLSLESCGAFVLVNAAAL